MIKTEAFYWRNLKRIVHVYTCVYMRKKLIRQWKQHVDNLEENKLIWFPQFSLYPFKLKKR